MNYRKEFTSLKNKFRAELRKKIKAIKGKEIQFNSPIMVYQPIFSEMLGDTFLDEKMITGLNKDGSFCCEDPDHEPADVTDMKHVEEMIEMLEALDKKDYEVIES